MYDTILKIEDRPLSLNHSRHHFPQLAKGMLTQRFVEVKDFMSPDVKMVYSDSNVSKAVDIMVENNIGSVLVVDSSGPVGIFSERDLLHNVLALGKQLEYQMVMEVMSKPFVEIRNDQTLFEAARAMFEKRSRLVVFEDTDIAGIVTATDIVREIAWSGKNFEIDRYVTRKVDTVHWNMDVSLVIDEMDEKRIGSVIVGRNHELSIFTERDLLKKVLALKVSLETPVGKVATKPLITAMNGIDGREAAQIIASRKVKRLPIVAGNELIGILTARDLVEAFASSY
jgi:predicted transcriptional regulator